MPSYHNSRNFWGASLSIKQCRSFDIRPEEVIAAAIQELGIKRFRLMSYWDEHEPTPGELDFNALDEQIRLIQELGGEVSLCLGARQPRWPENHWPDWAWQLPANERTEKLLAYITTVVERYKTSSAITSYQLENEALNRGFGTRGDFDRRRLRQEFLLVKSLDSFRPVIMTTSNNWGIPIRRPRPDVFGVSLYRVEYKNDAYHNSPFPAIWYRFRASAIKLLTRRDVFIHELQAEPWGPKNIWEMDDAEQAKSMDAEKLEKAINFALKTKLKPIDLWGLEWWYWRKAKFNDPSLWNLAHDIFVES